MYPVQCCDLSWRALPASLRLLLNRLMAASRGVKDSGYGNILLYRNRDSYLQSTSSSPNYQGVGNFCINNNDVVLSLKG